jgi:hypothetical protein
VKVLRRIADGPPARARPSTAFLVTLALVLGLPALAGEAFVDALLWILAGLVLAIWLVVGWLARRSPTLLALCDDGCLVWAGRERHLPWSAFDTLALHHDLSTATAHLGARLSLKLPLDELVPLVEEIAQRAGLEELGLHAVKQSFPDAARAWARPGALPDRTWVRLRDRAVLAAVVVVPLAGAVVFATPWALHALDRGEARVTVERLARGDRPWTRNLIVEGGHIVKDPYLSRTTENRDHTHRRWCFYALVPAGARADEPAHLILEAEVWPGAGLDELAAAPSLRVVLRDAPCEGLAARDAADRAALGGRRAADARLVELR